MSTLHAIFAHAARLGLIEANPANGVRKLATQPRIRRLSRAEIERLGKALRAQKRASTPLGSPRSASCC
jgi:hypothetical protein